jgi:hypothetical protein
MSFPGREWILFAIDRDGGIARRHAIAVNERAGETAERTQGALDVETEAGLGALLLIDPAMHPDDVMKRLAAALALKTPPTILKLIDPEDRGNWDGSPSLEARNRARSLRLADLAGAGDRQPPTL